MKNLNSLQPMAAYETPKYPTLEETKNDSKLLRKLPSRWKNNVAVIACVGMLTFGMLSGCTNECTIWTGVGHGGAGMISIYVTGPVGPEIPLIWSSIYDDLQVSVHHGGDGGAPTYLVHLTENEAKAILLARLDQFGLRFRQPPNNAPSIETWGEMTLDLFEHWHGIGLIFVSHEDSHESFAPVGADFAQNIRRLFAEVTDMPIGVFYNGGRVLENDLMTHRDELRQRIIAQADAFIIELRQQGILRGPTE